MKNENSTFQKLLIKRWALAQDTSPQAAKKLLALDKEFSRKYERNVAPFVLDMAGFTRLTMQHGILHYLTLIQRMIALCDPVVRKARGQLIKHEADNLFACFKKVDDAVETGVKIQKTLHESNLLTSEAFDIHTSIGIGYGATFLVGDDMWGSELNVASKLGEDIAEQGEILLTSAAQKALKGNKRYKLNPRTVNVSGMPYTAYLLKQK